MANERRPNGAGSSRREVLRRAGQLLLAPVTLLLAGKVEAAPQGVIVFRLRTCADGVGRRRCSCHACEKHAKNKYFVTPAAADSHRAHKHCNCVIVSETVSVAQYQQMFLPGTRLFRQVFDRRW
jgi:hypothetical protein